jgi:serine/threonine-protein phosphatase 2A regulatory subunit B
VDNGLTPTLKREFPNLHNYHINSISISSNCDNFISSDDLRIYLWDFESPQKAFNVVDTKPTDFNNLNEVITASQFDQTSDNQFIYSTSRGVIKLADLRIANQCDKTGVTMESTKYTENEFFRDILKSISDVTYSNDGQYIFARDF